MACTSPHENPNCRGVFYVPLNTSQSAEAKDCDSFGFLFQKKDQYK